MHRSCTSRPLCRRPQCTCRCQTVSNYFVARFHPSFGTFVLGHRSLTRLQPMKRTWKQLHTHCSPGRLKIMHKILITAMPSTPGPCAFCMLSCYRFVLDGFQPSMSASFLPSFRPSFLASSLPSLLSHWGTRRALGEVICSCGAKRSLRKWPRTGGTKRR